MDFAQAQKMMKLQQEAMKIKKELENTIIEAEKNWLVIAFNWEMKAEKVYFETKDLVSGLPDDKITALEESILECINKWVKKSQEVAAEKMKWVMWQMWMDIPGMPT